jgi:hypothetical protein
MLKTKRAKLREKPPGSGAPKSATISPAWEHDLEKVRRAAPPPPDDAVYEYLKKVFWFVKKWWKPTTFKDIKSEIEAYFKSNIDQRIKHERFRFIIELTAPSHINAKMKWKYVTALRVAREEKQKTSEVLAFIKGRGGLNKLIESRKSKKQKVKNKAKRPTHLNR